MFIEHFSAAEENQRDWFVKGHIRIDGEFTREEWEKIKVTFIAMGLSQLHRGKRLSDVFPTRAQCVDAMMEDTRNGNSKASEALRARYHIPSTVTLDEFCNHYQVETNNEFAKLEKD